LTENHKQPVKLRYPATANTALETGFSQFGHFSRDKSDSRRAIRKN
jgi:hypothetical protein